VVLLKICIQNFILSLIDISIKKEATELHFLSRNTYLDIRGTILISLTGLDEFLKGRDIHPPKSRKNDISLPFFIYKIKEIICSSWLAGFLFKRLGFCKNVVGVLLDRGIIICQDGRT